MDAPVAPMLCHKPAPVELGRFGGENPEAWLFQAGCYFNFYGIAAAYRLTLASFLSRWRSLGLVPMVVSQQTTSRLGPFCGES